MTMTLAEQRILRGQDLTISSGSASLRPGNSRFIAGLKGIRKRPARSLTAQSSRNCGYSLARRPG